MKERRVQRFKAEFRIFFSGEGGEGEGTLLDLSKTGCRVQSETEAGSGSEVAAWIYPPDHDWPLKIDRAVVRWTKQTEFGLEFVEMLPAQKERLRLVLDDKRQRR